MIAEPALRRPSAWRVWLMATRPPTLTAAIAPVLVGTAAADAVGPLRALPFVAALAAAILIQIGTNFANDLADFQRGADHAGRVGPTRVTQSGLVSQRQMWGAVLLIFGCAALIGGYLIVVAGWPILAVGVAAIVAGLAYTGGPWPFGYHGLGDLFVFLFFGLIAVMGSYYVQREDLTWEALAAAISVGLTVTAILVVNNLRDIESDRAGGKGTLAVRLGPRLTRVEYGLLLLAPYGLVAVLSATGLLPWWSWLCWLSLPLAVHLTRRVALGAMGCHLNPLLKQTGRLHLLFGILLAISLIL